MKRKAIILVLIFWALCIAAGFVMRALADESGPHRGAAAVVAAPAEPPPDVKGLKIDGLTWKKRYYEALMENLKMAYRIKMLESPRWIALRRGLDDTKAEIDRLTAHDDETTPAQPEVQTQKTHKKEDVNR